MKKSHIIILVIALLGGGAYAALEYWNDIAPLIGMGGPPPVPARAARPVDTAPVQSAEPKPEEFQTKLGEIIGAVWVREGKFLFGIMPHGFTAIIKRFAVSYPAELKRKNLDLTGKLLWSYSEERNSIPWRVELNGEPVGQIIAGSLGEGQIQDVIAKRSYTGAVVVERLLYEITNPLMLFPVSHYGFKVTGAEAGEEDGVVKLTLEPESKPDNGFFAIREMTMEIRGEEYELVSYAVKMYIDGKIVTHSVRWEKDGDNYRIITDNGTLVVQGERTEEQMVLVCEGVNPATYTFTYGDSAITGVTVAMKRDGVDYILELAEVKALTDFSGEQQLTVGADFRNPTAAAAWATAKLGWMDPEEAAVPADEAGGEGEASDTTARASAEESADTAAGEEEKPAEGENEEEATPAREERATASARPATPARTTPARETARPSTPAASDNADEGGEEEAAAPASPAAPARPAAVRPAPTASAARPASGGAATAVRPASRPASSAYTLGVKAYREGRHVDAERQLSTAVRQQPGNASAQLMLGEIYYGRGDYGRAQACLSRASQLSSQTWIGARARQMLQRMGYSY